MELPSSFGTINTTEFNSERRRKKRPRSNPDTSKLSTKLSKRPESLTNMLPINSTLVNSSPAFLPDQDKAEEPTDTFSKDPSSLSTSRKWRRRRNEKLNTLNLKTYNYCFPSVLLSHRLPLSLD
jgi:hypothetical protein